MRWMRRRGRAIGPVVVFVLAAAGVVAGVVYVYQAGQRPPVDPRAQNPTTLPTTHPATAPTTRAAERKPVRTYADVILAAHPDLPTTQPLGVPVDLADAGHFVLSDPLHVCARQDLWITRPDGPTTEETLKTARADQTHVVRDRVVYVHWGPDPDEGGFRPMLVCPTDADGFEVVDVTGRRAIPGSRPWRWDRAWSWDDRVIVPTDRGVSIFAIPAIAKKELPTGPPPQPTEAYHEFAFADGATAAGALSEPQMTFDFRGLLAWMPWENGKAGSAGAARFVDGAWQTLGPEQGWPAKLLHIVPLRDGSVLQLVVGETDVIEPKMTILDAPEVDEEKVTKLVDQLSDTDGDVRRKAFAELSLYGPGVWPILERLVEDQPPEAKIRVRQLLANKVEPTVGGMTLLDGEARTAARFKDGGLLLYADGGVGVPREGRDPAFIVPAWISVRPGRTLEVLGNALVEDADPDKHRFFTVGDEWAVWDAVQGMRRLLGNHLAPVTNDKERDYAHLVGIDRRGRWLLKTAPDATETLVVDPTIPDPTPKLPVWLLWIENGQVGWDKEDWPTIKRGGGWILHESTWRPLDEQNNELITDPPPATVTVNNNGSDGSNTGSATAPATSPSLVPSLLTTKDGTKYFGGQTELRVVAPDGKETTWPLPASAQGTATPHLVAANDGRLFLFNEPGRVLRIKPTPGAAEPFAVEATFTHRVPNSTDIRRIWLDPAGRIVIAYDGDRLAICFPEGRIPWDVATLIPAKELQD